MSGGQLGVSPFDVIEAIRPVIDPDMDISIVDLGLLRDVDIQEGKGPGARHVEIQMTLTSPGCPIAPELMAAVQGNVEKLSGVASAHVSLVWSPPWDPRTDATEEALAELGIWV